MTSSSKSKIIIFMRYPRPGRVKTRLIQRLGESGAVHLHKGMTAHTLNWARVLLKKKNFSLEIRYDDASLNEMRDWLGEDLSFAVQGEGDLGDRMARAFQDAFAQGAKCVVLVGTDCPQLNVPVVRMAFSYLKDRDMVIIPAEDGGYCLLGLKTMIPDLFKGIEWGSDSVCRTTLERAEESSLKTEVFASLRDVDTPDDLAIWGRVSSQYLSIIIPTLNEEDHIGEILRHLQTIPDCEVIVADGGSRDKTLSIVVDMKVKLVRTKRGRGTQMNSGAAVASGDIFLFLHSDTQPPADFAEFMRKALSNPEVGGGAFGLKLRPITPLLRITEKTINWRTKYLSLPYGDQAYFVRASLFKLMGGYADIPLMEDVEFLRRLRKIGKFALIPEPVITSSRLFTENGVIRTSLKNKVVFFGYLLGVSSERLHRIYYKRKEKSKKV